MAKIDIFANSWTDIVFEGRNKEYGAYELRKESSKYTLRGILLSLVLVAIAIAMPIITRLISGVIEDNRSKVKVEEVNLADIPPVDKTTPPPPPVEPPPPLKATVKFTPPEIKPDKEVPNEEPPPVQEEIKADIGTKTVEGDDKGVPNGLDEGNNVVDEAPAQVFTIVEQMPEFPGGEAELFKFLGSKINYPQLAKENGIAGRVFVNFVVDSEGKIKDVKVVRGIGGGCDEEAMRVVRSMPNWKPGKQNGRAVNVSYNLPIKFSLR